MPILRGTLAPEGALVQILVGLDASSVQATRAALRPVPSPVRVRALLDTGAEITCVDSALIQTLCLAVLGYEALIGRDVLAQCRFLFNGPRNRFLLAY